MRFISGMVNEPVVTVLAMELPFIEPKSPLEIIATFAGPPVERPAIAVATSINSCPNPVLVTKIPKRTK